MDASKRVSLPWVSIHQHSAGTGPAGEEATLNQRDRIGRGTLSRKLAFRTTALVAAITIVLSGVTLATSYQTLTQGLDNRLATALTRSGEGRSATSDDPEGSGMIRIDKIRGVTFISWPQAEDTRTIERYALLLSRVKPGVPHTMIVGNLGPYRILNNGATIVGLPLRDVHDQMRRHWLFAIIFTLAAIALAYFGARTVVAISMRGLNRLADTATRVSALPLSSGEVAVPVRFEAEVNETRDEVGQVGLALNQMLDHVERALEARHRSEQKVRQFVADASHELRNPLAAIRGYSELAVRNRAELSGDSMHALERINGAADQMSALVEDLLLLAHLDSQPTLDLKPTDVTEIVLKAVGDAKAAGAGYNWKLELPAEPLFANADPYRLQQVLANLLGNARTHTPAGTTVLTRLWQAGSDVCVAVCDDGPGVPPEIADRVFERFSRAESSRVRHAGAPSTGLGLAIVAAVIEAHCGHVVLESVPGDTQFTITLPACDPPLSSAD
ncbi:MAG: HAMP domain-containing histidine kinase [Propionibacteriaceae bacterium]|nr:HAMP domain-containing histidine kinase [Propionibacteriaceae bacterium]